MRLILISNCRLDFWLQWLRFSLDVGCRRRSVMIDVCEVEIISSRRLSNTASAATLTAHCQFKPEKNKTKGSIFLWPFCIAKADAGHFGFKIFSVVRSLLWNYVNNLTVLTPRHSPDLKKNVSQLSAVTISPQYLLPHKELGISLAK